MIYSRSQTLCCVMIHTGWLRCERERERKFPFRVVVERFENTARSEKGITHPHPLSSCILCSASLFSGWHCGKTFLEEEPWDSRYKLESDYFLPALVLCLFFCHQSSFIFSSCIHWKTCGTYWRLEIFESILMLRSLITCSGLMNGGGEERKVRFEIVHTSRDVELLLYKRIENSIHHSNANKNRRKQD